MGAGNSANGSSSQSAACGVFLNLKEHVRIVADQSVAGGASSQIQGVIAELRASLFWSIQGSLKFSYGKDKYKNFMGPIRRESEMADFEIGATRWFANHYFISMNLAYHDEQSNYTNLSYDRTLAGLNLGFYY